MRKGIHKQMNVMIMANDQNLKKSTQGDICSITDRDCPKMDKKIKKATIFP